MKNLKTTVNSPASDRSYVTFLNQLELGISFEEIATKSPHSDSELRGWKGILSLVCRDRQQQLYDVDMRYAWGREIFTQHLIDYGWTEGTLLFRKSFSQSNSRHKLIIYLCTASTGLDVPQKVQRVARDFLIGEYWQSITHVYLQLDCLAEINSTFVSNLPLPQRELVETKSPSYLTIDRLAKTLIAEKESILPTSYYFLIIQLERGKEGYALEVFTNSLLPNYLLFQ